MEITQYHLDLARQHDACSVPYQPGMKISEVTASDLRWFAKQEPELAQRVAAEMSAKVPGLQGTCPLYFFGSGYGYGYGCGYGDGSGDGSGYGDGYGYGYGSGDGSGYGDGYGYGCGDGDGDGDGHGYGYGDGS